MTRADESERGGAGPAEPRPLRRDRRAWALLGGAVLLRAVVGADVWLHEPLARELLSDPALYRRWASALAAGEAFRPGEPYWLPPLYPHLLALAFRAGLGVLGALVLQLAAGVGTTALAVALCDRTVGRRAALLAGAAWTLYAPVVFFETRLLPVNAALPLCAGALLVLCGRSAPSPARSLASGALCGLAALARPNLLLAGPFLAAALARRRGARAAGALLLGVALGVLPAALRNRAECGEWIPVTANGGINFWFGNNARAHGTFHAPGPEWGSIEDQRAVALAIARRELGRDVVTDGAASAFWTRRALAWMAAEPGDALRLWGLKLADLLSSTELGIQYYLPAQRRAARSLWLPFLPFGALLALGVLGARGPCREARALLLAWLAAGVAATLLYFTYSRFRLPLLLGALPFVGAGAARALDALRGRARLGAGELGLALALLAQSFVPFEGAYPRQLCANSLVDTAGAWRARGEPERARAALEEALALVPANAKALVELGRLDLARGDERAARERFARAWSVPGAFPPALYELARLSLGAADPSLRDPAGAVAALRAWTGSPTADPDRGRLEVLLAAALMDNPELALAPDEARRLLEGALAREPGRPDALLLLERAGG